MRLNKAVHYSFLPLSCRTIIDELFESSSNTLFSAILNNPDHVLRFLPPRPKKEAIRKRSHGLTLTATQPTFVRNNLFIKCCTKTFIDIVLRA